MAIDTDATSGKGVPSSGSQWAEALARLSSPLHHWDCQDTASPLVDSINAADLAWGGATAAYQKTIPGWTRKGVGYGSGSAGGWVGTGVGTDPSLGDDGSGPGSVLIFMLGRQRITGPPAGGFDPPGGFSPPDAYSYSVIYSNLWLSVGTITASLTNSQTRYRVVSGGVSKVVLATPDDSHADDAVHAFLMQARELDVNSVEISLDTDLVSLEVQAGTAPSPVQLDAVSSFTLQANHEIGGPINFDYLDCWIWRGVAPLDADERNDLLVTLGYRTPSVGGSGTVIGSRVIGSPLIRKHR